MNQVSFDASDYQGTGPQNYEKYFVPAIAAPIAEALVCAACLQPHERVLDVACGTGVVTRRVARALRGTGRVAGLDVNPGMLAVARATSGQLAIDWYETSAEAMPLPDTSYDVALCQMGLQFIPSRAQTLREIHRVLAPGGRVLVNLPGPKPELFAIMSEALVRHIDPRCGNFVDVVFSLHDPDQLTDLMSDAEFDDVENRVATHTLTLPAPGEFLWQYIHSTPVAGLVREATARRRDALAVDVIEQWQKFVVGGALNLAVDVTTVQGRRAS